MNLQTGQGVRYKLFALLLVFSSKISLLHQVLIWITMVIEVSHNVLIKHRNSKWYYFSQFHQNRKILKIVIFLSNEILIITYSGWKCFGSNLHGFCLISKPFGEVVKIGIRRMLESITVKVYCIYKLPEYPKENSRIASKSKAGNRSALPDGLTNAKIEITGNGRRQQPNDTVEYGHVESVLKLNLF